MNIEKLIEKAEEQGCINQLEALSRNTYNLKVFNLSGVELFCLKDVDLYDEISFLNKTLFLKKS